MSDSQSINTLLLDIMISSKNECVISHYLSDLTLQIIFDVWCASRNVGSKLPIAWRYSRHGPTCCIYLHCRTEETGKPGIICIVCHQVLCDPSDHGTSSNCKHLLPQAQIAKLNESTESDVSELTNTTVDETALAIWRYKGVVECQ